MQNARDKIANKSEQKTNLKSSKLRDDNKILLLINIKLQVFDTFVRQDIGKNW